MCDSESTPQSGAESCSHASPRRALTATTIEGWVSANLSCASEKSRSNPGRKFFQLVDAWYVALLLVEHLKVVPENKHRHAKHNASQPLDEHLCEALGIFLRKSIEEIAAQEVEEHTGPAGKNCQ